MCVSGCGQIKHTPFIQLLYHFIYIYILGVCIYIYLYLDIFFSVRAKTRYLFFLFSTTG